MAYPVLARLAVRLDAVDEHRLGYDVADLHARVQRAVRILEDHLHAPPPGDQFPLPQLPQILSLVQDLPRGRPFQLQDAAAGRRLAAAGLADESQGSEEHTSEPQSLLR